MPTFMPGSGPDGYDFGLDCGVVVRIEVGASALGANLATDDLVLALQSWRIVELSMLSLS